MVGFQNLHYHLVAQAIPLSTCILDLNFIPKPLCNATCIWIPKPWMSFFCTSNTLIVHVLNLHFTPKPLCNTCIINFQWFIVLAHGVLIFVVLAHGVLIVHYEINLPNLWPNIVSNKFVFFYFNTKVRL